MNLTGYLSAEQQLCGSLNPVQKMGGFLAYAGDKAPYIGSNLNWYVYDRNEGAFIDSGLRAPGVGLDIKGTYDTLEALEAAVTDAKQGYMYNVGLTAPYTVYMWDTTVSPASFISQGQIKGQDGKDGVDGADGAPGAPGQDGADGAQGEPGANGVGVPTGGTAGQVLKKKSNTNYDTEWGAVGSGVPAGGTTGQVLKKQSNTDGDAAWGDAKGVIENTTAIDAIADGDKFIIEDVSAAAGSKIKHTLWSAVKTALLSIFAPALMADKTIYVATTGNDTTGDGSSGSPYATLQKAVDSIHKNLNGFTVTINVAAGTYTTNVTIKNINNGIVQITGAGVASTFIVGYIRVENARSVQISSLKITASGANALIVTLGASCIINGAMTFDGASKTYIGIQTSSGGTVSSVWDIPLVFNNCSYAVSTYQGFVFSAGVHAGTNNNVAFSGSNGIVCARSNGISATTATSESNGGKVFVS